MPNNLTTQRLLLGDVNFFRFEVPDAIPNLFGTQKLAIHDFAGGGRTVQQLGSFPFPDISWQGTFFNGDAVSGGGLATAITRASLLNTYRVMAQPIDLIWGPFQYSVIVAEFEIIGKLEQQLEYRIKVVPLVDNTTTSTQPSSLPNTTAILGNAATGVTIAVGTPVGLLIPATLRFAAAQISLAVTTAIIQANGSAQGITSNTQAVLQAQISAEQLALQPTINGSDFGAASGAIILSASLSTLSTVLNTSNTSPPVTTITVTNPNLYQLAAQYYGDNTLWPLIAQQNNFQDAFPLGTFTIVIPSTSIQSPLIPTS